MFGSERPGRGNADLWMTKRNSPSEPWDQPVNLGSLINTADWNHWPSLSADGRWLFYTTYHTNARNQIMISRQTDDGRWGPPRNLADEIDLPANALGPTVSPDGCTLYFWSEVAEGVGGMDIWEIDIMPLVDLNGDGAVDAADLCSVVNHWGMDEPSCDVGPAPWGDGNIDVNDLTVVAEHLFEEVNDPTLAAYWALDETDGATAYDSVSGNEDIVVGGALWQPTGGVVGGALELDGVDDCIITTFGPNPAEGPFSIFAWIKGGSPGQAVISEPMGTNWLMADSEGKLITELRSPGRASAPMLSQEVITDGLWHRVGLVWDGSQRLLCVDDITVAEDTQNGLEIFNSGLYIGVGQDRAAGSFFSGLIDEIRVYNRAVKP
jgi:hypothetical protein